MIGDFLIESACEHHHTSSAAFRGYQRAHVDNVLGWLSEVCSHAGCTARVRHTLTALGSVEERRIADTQPSMRYVDVEDVAREGQRAARR